MRTWNWWDMKSGGKQMQNGRKPLCLPKTRAALFWFSDAFLLLSSFNTTTRSNTFTSFDYTNKYILPDYMGKQTTENSNRIDLKKRKKKIKSIRICQSGSSPVPFWWPPRLQLLWSSENSSGDYCQGHSVCTVLYVPDIIQENMISGMPSQIPIHFCHARAMSMSSRDNPSNGGMLTFAVDQL